MECRRCKKDISDYSKFCPNCGLDLSKKNNNFLIPLATILGSLLISALIIVLNFKSTNNTMLDDKDIDEEHDITDVQDGENTFNKFDPSKIEFIPNTTELGKNISIDEIYLEDTYSKSKRAHFLLTNNNSEAFSIKLTVYFYDKDGYQIDKKYSSAVFFPNTKLLLDLYIIADQTGYDKVKVEYETSKIVSYYTIVDNVEYSHKISDKGVEITLKNKSNLDIFNANFVVEYYKNNEVVFANNVFFSRVEASESAVSYSYNFSLKNNGKEIEYDSYKIYLSNSIYYARG